MTFYERFLFYNFYDVFFFFVVTCKYDFRQNAFLVRHFAYLVRQNVISSRTKYIFSPKKCNLVQQNTFLVRKNYIYGPTKHQQALQEIQQLVNDKFTISIFQFLL
jgi:hypothetical protein